VFATPTGERHEIGLQSAALTAMGAGANPIYLGAELPVADLLGAVADTNAAVLALGLVTVPRRQTSRMIEELRNGLPKAVRIWLGGPGAHEIPASDGVEAIASIEELEKRVTLLAFEKQGPQ
jgi:methanogenic corrinoid protein MtbC1